MTFSEGRLSGRLRGHRLRIDRIRPEIVALAIFPIVVGMNFIGIDGIIVAAIAAGLSYVGAVGTRHGQAAAAAVPAVPLRLGAERCSDAEHCSHAEHGAIAASELLRLLDAIPSVISYWDSNLAQRFANRAYHDSCGIDVADLPGINLRDILGKADFARKQPHIEAVLRGDPQSFVVETDHDDTGKCAYSQVDYLPSIVDGVVIGFYKQVADITEFMQTRLELAAALHANEALLESLDEQFIVSVTDPGGRIIEANRCLQRVSGYASEDLVGQTHCVMKSATHDAEFFEDVWRTITTGTAWRGEICNRARDGSLFWVNSVIVPIRTLDGGIDRYIMISSDITAAKQTETKLLASNRFLDNAGRAADVGGWQLDLPTGVVTWSDQTYRIHEVEPDYIPEHDHPILRYGEGARETSRNAIDAAIAKGTPWDFEIAIVSGKGRPLWLRAVGAPEYCNGRMTRLVGAIQDVTAAKSAAVVLADERQLMTSLLDTLPDLVYFKDLEGRYLRINASMASHFGVADAAALVGRRSGDFISAADLARVVAAEQAMITTGDPAPEMEFQVFWPNRAPTWHRSVKLPLRNAVGDIVGTFGVSRDITVAKADEEKLLSVARFLERSEDVAKTGGWAFDLRTRQVTWSAQTYKLHQVAADYTPTLRTAGRFFPGPARQVIEAAIKACVAHGTAFDCELPFVTAKGEALWVHSVGAAERENGIIVRINGAMQDVTTRKRAEERSRSTEALLARSERVARVGGWEYDLRTGAISWSAQTHLIHEVDPDYVPSMETLGGFYPDGAFAILEGVIAKAIQTGVGWDIELPFVTARQHPLWINAVGTAELENGEVVRLIGTIQDITERNIVAQRLRSSEAFLDYTGQIAGVGGWEVDLGTRVLAFSAQTFRIHETDFVARDYLTALPNYPPASRALIRTAVRVAIADGSSWDLELPFVTNTGAKRWVRMVGTASTRDGRTTRLVGSIQDITARKNAEIDQRRTAAMLRTVLDSVTDVAIIGTDLGKGITVVNAGAERLFGYSSAEFLGGNVTADLFDADEVRQRAAMLSTEIGRTVAGVAVFTDPSVYGKVQEWACRRKDGRLMTIAMMLRPMFAEDESVNGYVIVAHDVTDQKQYEASLRDATHRAEAANRAKSDFLANMSHEIRTPINTVIGVTYLLGRSNLDADQNKLLGTVVTASQSLLSVINDVLDLSKIEAGEMLIEHVAFAPAAVFAEVMRVVAAAAEGKAIALTLDLAPDLPAALSGDVIHLRQILTNLLSNAIKFTDRGSVTLRVRRPAETATSTTLEIVVADTGIGIAAESRHRLFTPFSQADTSITRRFGGTGLGLSIVKQLVTLMGGEVGVASEEGVGSAFTVTLDFARATPDALARQVDPPVRAGEIGLDGVRILIVDDSAINLEVTKRILDLEGAHVELACNGLAALDRLRTGPRDFDLVLMDVQMPVLNGYDATRRIREELGLSALPIIALTANALSSERVRATQAGMNDFIVKPFNVEALVRSIRRLVSSTRSIPTRSPVDTGGPDRNAALATQALAIDAWPEIAGIETDDVRARLGGDLILFKQLLGMFLAEFADLSSLRTDDAAALTATAAGLHKLLGNAGLLGATTIHELGREAENASRAGDGAGTKVIIARIAVLVDQLSTSARPLLAVPALSVDTDAAAASPRDLASLIDLLERQSLMAGGAFRAVSPHVRRLIDDTAFLRLQGDIDNLRFAAAATQLRSLAASEKSANASAGGGDQAGA